jgi:hypothetical protein
VATITAAAGLLIGIVLSPRLRAKDPKVVPGAAPPVMVPVPPPPPEGE